MLPLEPPDRIHVAFDDHRLVSNAGLLLPLTLAHHLGLGPLVDRHVDLGDAPGRANAGDKLLTLVASALAGGDCIDDADALRAGGTARVMGCTVKAPSTLGTFLRSFRWGHVRPLDRVSRAVLARAWAVGAGPGDGPLTIDLDSTVCETHGLAKEGARHHNYAGQRGYHPLLAIAAGTGDVLMARLRQGRAHTARGAAHFLRETLSRVRQAGATGPLTVRADSGFYTHGIVALCRSRQVRFSITVRQHPALCHRIEAIPEEDWTPIPYWMEGAADVAETTCTPFAHKADAAPVRLIVRRVKPTPGSQLALFTDYSHHAFITDREGDTLALEADHRRQRRLAGGPGPGPQPGPLDRTPRAGPAADDHQDPPATLLRPGRTHHPQGPPSHLASPPGLALAKSVPFRPGTIARPAAPFLIAPPICPPIALAQVRQAGPGASPAAIRSPILAVAGVAARPTPPPSAGTPGTRHHPLGSNPCPPASQPSLLGSTGPPHPLRWIWVHIPDRYRKLGNHEAVVEDLINGGSLRYAIHQRLQEVSEGIRRWPQGGFLDGNVFDLGRLIPAMALPKEHVEAVAEDAANCVKAAAERLESGLPQKAQNEVGVLMRQQTLLSGLHTTALMWLNAMLVQQRLFLQESPAVKAEPLTTCTDLSDQIRVWKDILAENWRSIFKPAVQALELARQHSPAAAQEAIRVLTQAVESIETAPLGMHMNVGAELYPKLSDDRKEAAAFYTQSATAELLAALTIRRRDLTADQWAGDVFANHRLADLACGTGTLLRAGYRRIEALHNHSNAQLGKDSKNGGGYCMSRRWNAVLSGPT